MRPLTVVPLLFPFFLSYKDCQAQIFLTSPSGATIRNVRYVPTGRLNILNSSSEIEIKGSPYLTDAYSSSDIHLQDGKFSGVEMRYNIFYDQMEFKEKDSVLAIGPDPFIKKVVMGTQIFVIDSIETKDGVFATYFQRLDSGRLTLMAKPMVIYKELERAKPMQGDVPPRYERMPDSYYIKIGRWPIKKISTLKKLIDALPDRNAEMESYTQNEKIRSNKPDDLIKFTHYYNSL